uniref:Succinate dehydrogenase assembly factor mitochondrial-like protein n=1 Tax=Triatoma infestans TaxID=30076 RepID=A0A161MNU7_TRIIF
MSALGIILFCVLYTFALSGNDELDS